MTEPGSSAPSPESVDLLAVLAADLADQVTRQYRIDRANAVATILDDWRRQPKLMAAVARASSPDEVRRLRIYRDAAAAAKGDIYRRLRRYRAEPDAFDSAVGALRELDSGAQPELLVEPLTAVAAAHVSTAERLPHRDEFLAAIAGVARGAACVVDVGCGVLPLMYPPGFLTELGIEQYWALDTNAHAQQALAEYVRIRQDGRLRPVNWSLADGWDVLFAAGLPRHCDLALLLKVVPVVARQSPELLRGLADVPADRLLVSGSRIAMAKRREIERREFRMLQRFRAEFRFSQEAEFRTADEFFVVLVRD